MKKLKSIFCQTFSDYKGTKIHHIDEILAATFKGRELYTFADLYASRVENDHNKKNRQKAFWKGVIFGVTVCLIFYFFSK